MANEGKRAIRLKDKKNIAAVNFFELISNYYNRR